MISADDPAAPLGAGHSNTLHFTVDASEAEGRRRLDRWLSERIPDRARNQIQLDIAAGRVLVNGQPRAASYSVVPGDKIDCEIPAEVATRLEPESIPLSIIFEDEHLVVVNKPAGLVVHPAPGHTGGTLANALLAHCGPSLEGVGGEGRWGLVHRLDAGTSGLLIAAKTQPAYEALVAALADRRISRQYLGIVVGQLRDATGSIDRPIGRRRNDRKRMGVVRDGRAARTDWRVLLQSGGMALVALTLHSGRTHQIRVHMQAIGRPILGDDDYGWTKRRTLESLDPERRPQVTHNWPNRPMLHAARLKFEHPIIPEKTLQFLLQPPADFDPIAEEFWGDAWRKKIAFE